MFLNLKSNKTHCFIAEPTIEEIGLWHNRVGLLAVDRCGEPIAVDILTNELGLNSSLRLVDALDSESLACDAELGEEAFNRISPVIMSSLSSVVPKGLWLLFTDSLTQEFEKQA